MKKYLSPLFLSALVTLMSFPIYAQNWQKDKAYYLTVLHMNDHHGSFWPDGHGQGGLAAEKTVVDLVRQEVAAQGGHVLLLSAGDIDTGVPESDLLKAEPDFKGMDLMKFDAMAVGNHEYDHDYEVIKAQEKWVHFPFLSANIYDKQTKKRAFKPYAMFNFDGIKIAVVGLTTDDTPKISAASVGEHFAFNSPIMESKAILKDLAENEKPDIKIALTHLGYYEDAKYGSNTPGDVSLARGLDAGAYDMIIGGHSHTAVCMAGVNKLETHYQPMQPCQPDFQNGMYIMQALSKSQYLGRADFIFKNGKLTLSHYQLIPINLKHKVMVGEKSEYQLYDKEIAQDPAMVALLTPYQEQGTKLIGFKVGTTSVLLQGERDIVRSSQTNLGRMIADANQSKVGADLAVMNSGGVRNSIAAGDITYRDILKVLPFGNQIARVDLTGAELTDYLTALALKEPGSGAYVQFSSNISLDINYIKKIVTNIKINGQFIDPVKSYRIALPNFSAAGGDKYPIVSTRSSYVDTGFIDADSFKEYIKNMGTVTFKEAMPVHYIQE